MSSQLDCTRRHLDENSSKLLLFITIWEFLKKNEQLKTIWWKKWQVEDYFLKWMLKTWIEDLKLLFEHLFENISFSYKNFHSLFICCLSYTIVMLNSWEVVWKNHLCFTRLSLFWRRSIEHSCWEINRLKEWRSFHSSSCWWKVSFFSFCRMANQGTYFLFNLIFTGHKRKKPTLWFLLIRFLGVTF